MRVQDLQTAAELVERVERGRPDARGRATRVGERHPALRPLGGAPDRGGAVAAHPDRGVGPLDGPGPHDRAARAEVPALGDELVLRPHAAHDVDRLVGELVALVEVGTQRRELRLEVAGGDAEDDASAREHVEAEHRLRGQERIPVREHEDVCLHPQLRGRRRRERERDERVERVVSAAREPLGVRGRVIGHEARVEACALRRRGAGHHRVARDELRRVLDVVRRQPDRESHHRNLDEARTGRRGVT